MSTSKYQIILEFLTVAVGAYVPAVYKVIFKAEKRPLFQTKNMNLPAAAFVTGDTERAIIKLSCGYGDNKL